MKAVITEQQWKGFLVCLLGRAVQHWNWLLAEITAPIDGLIRTDCFTSGMYDAAIFDSHCTAKLLGEGEHDVYMQYTDT